MRRYLEAGNLVRLEVEYPHVFTERFDFDAVGSWLLGRDARAVLDRCSTRFDEVILRLDAILATELDSRGSLGLVSQMSPRDPESALTLVTALRAGLRGEELP